MSDDPEENQPERHSKAFEAELITDPDALARREARNGLRQYDEVLALIEYFMHPDRPFRLRPSHILHLHRIALEGITRYAGNYRPANIEIQGSKHNPVGAHLVPEKVEDLCDYVNTNWRTRTPIHLASYVLWRLNWIHPFTDGNGRTSRAISYAVLCIRLGYTLPGANTIPEQISRDKLPYYRALETADCADSEGQLDISELEKYLAALLANQLLGVHEQATGIG
jgi:Fic family protein